MDADDFPGGVSRELDESAGQPMDEVDDALLREVAQLLTDIDPVPADLISRIQFSLALDEMFTEVARISRMPLETSAVRNDPVAGQRTETLTFSAERLTAMVTVTRNDGRLRIDGWVAPPAPVRVRLRMQDEADREVLADDSGRFVLDGLPEGFAQLSFHPVDTDDDAAVVVTPMFQL